MSKSSQEKSPTTSRLDATGQVPKIHAAQRMRFVRAAQKLISSRDYAEALSVVREGLKNFQGDSYLLTQAGVCLWETGDLKGGTKALIQACRAAPDNARLYAIVGEFFLKKRRMRLAIRCCRRACAIKPENDRYWYMLGSSLRMHGAWKESAQAMEKVLALNPRHAEAHFELGLSRLASDDLPAAVQHLERAALLNPGNTRQALMAVAARMEIQARETGRPGGRRIAIHLNQDLHVSILEPVFRALSARHHVRVISDPRLAAIFKPDIVIVADAQAARLREWIPGAIFIYIRHGLITKNHAFKAASHCDYLAGVSSLAIRDLAIKHGGFAPERIWVTGYVQMDALFSGTSLPLPIALPENRRTILFAPTYNRRLSAAPMLDKRIVELIRAGRDDLNIVIKPHPITRTSAPDWLRIWRRLAQENDDVYLIDDPGADAMAFLQSADVLISDACSMAFAYLTLDRPIILLTNPEREADPNYDPVGIEWMWRDLGEELFDAKELPAAVRRALENPRQHADRRAHYRNLLFGEFTDGRAAERIAGHIDVLGSTDSPGTGRK